MLGSVERGIRVLFQETQHVVPPHEIQLARLHGFDGQFVRTAGNHRVQAEKFARFGDSNDQRLAIARGSGKLGTSLAKDENSTRALSLDQNHRVLRENGGVFYLVERLDRVVRQVAEKIA
jgi:hypothetical protein